MATIYAAATGNWSATSTWTGGVLPQPGDIVIAGGFNVTIDQDIDVAEIRNAGTPNGGQFLLTALASPRTLDCEWGTGGPGPLVVLSATSGSLVITGSVRGQGASNADGLSITGAGTTVTVQGDVIAGTGTNGHGVDIGASCTLTVNGSARGGSNTGKGISATSGTNSITVDGDAIAGQGNSSASAIYMSSTDSSIVVKGDARANTGKAVEIVQASSTIDLWGTAYASPMASAVFGPNSCTVTVGGAVDAPSGRQAVIAGSIKRYTGSQIVMATGDLDPAQVALTLAASDYPAAANVRSGTAFGAAGASTGTMAVPAASSVGVGVPVDTAVGTATLPLADAAAVTGAQITAAVGG